MIRFFVIGIVILGFILGMLFLPRARITLDLTSEPFTHNLEVRVDAELEKIFPQLDSIPARLLEVPEVGEIVMPDGFVTIEEPQDVQSGEILVFKEADLLALVDIKIKPILEELSKLEKEESANQRKISWQVEELNLAEKYAKLKVHLEKTVYPKLDLGKIKESLAGKSKKEIEKYLEGWSGLQGVEVRFWPSFLKTAPVRIKSLDIFLNIF